MYVTIDRFEGEFAIVELPDKTFEKMSKALLPSCAEGDIINIEKDISRTEEAKKKAQALFDSLFE